MISRIPNLKVLDFERVTHKERQQALSKFNFAPEKLRLEEEEAKIAKDKKEKIKVLLKSLLFRIWIKVTIFSLKLVTHRKCIHSRRNQPHRAIT